MDETDFTLLQAGGDNDTISVYRQGLFYVYMWRNAGLPWDEINAWGEKAGSFHIEL